MSTIISKTIVSSEEKKSQIKHTFQIGPNKNDLGFSLHWNYLVEKEEIICSEKEKKTILQSLKKVEALHQSFCTIWKMNWNTYYLNFNQKFKVFEL